MTALVRIAAAITLALGVAFATAPRDEFETGIFIDAPPETVWALLTDPAEHQRWNPNMREVEGRFEAGERVSLTMGTPSGGDITFRPEILVAIPETELRWLGRLGLPRLFDGEHYFVLVAENGGTRLIQGERFHGLLLWVMDVQQFRPAFDAANEGLKARAEDPSGRRGAARRPTGAHASTGTGTLPIPTLAPDGQLIGCVERCPRENPTS